MAILKRVKHRNRQNQMSKVPNSLLEDMGNQKLSGSLQDTVDLVTGIMGDNDDFVIRRFQIFGRYNAAMFYFTDLAAQSVVNDEILKSLMHLPPHLEEKHIKLQNLENVLLNEVLYHSKGFLETSAVQSIEACFRGDTAIVVEGLEGAFIIGTRFVEKRAIDQPQTEQVLRGAREGFIEPIGTNISLIRYRLQTPNFRVRALNIGRMTKTKAVVCYIEGVADPALVDEVFHRLGSVDIDAVLDSGYLEQYIEDNHWSPFPQVANTERPDKTVANLLEGRVAILTDGSPMALVVPAVFNQFYQTLDDYSERFLMGSLVRFVRLVSLIFSLVFSSLYVSVIAYNPELIPTKFAVAVAGGRAGVPYPAVVEVLIMEISMEVLREATLRLPQQVGGALSIVGVLVIGQAAVSAGFASPITVVVIALTTIGSFATPAYNAAIALRMLRFLLIGLAGIWGLYGVMIGLVLITNHILSLRSFGVRYISPLVPGDWQGMKDTLIRAPLWWMPKRPAFLQSDNSTRISDKSIEATKRVRHNVFNTSNVGGKGRKK